MDSQRAFTSAGTSKGAASQPYGGLGVGHDLGVGQSAVAPWTCPARPSPARCGCGRRSCDGRGSALAAWIASRPPRGRGRPPQHVPARGGEARLLVGGVGQRHLAVDGDPLLSKSTTKRPSRCIPRRPRPPGSRPP
jgi:hypothetical protein